MKARCDKCGYVWEWVREVKPDKPMDAAVLVKIAKSVRCISCGATARHVYIADDDAVCGPAPKTASNAR